jgi:hypothetical protein
MPSFKTIGRTGWEAVRQYIDKIPVGDDKRRDVSITLHRVKRTIPQNRLYRLWLGLIADETGNNTDDLHEAFKVMFLGIKDFTIGGISAQAPISTTTLDTKQFTSFLERLEAWVTVELGIILPHPEDAYWVEFEQRYGSL